MPRADGARPMPYLQAQVVHHRPRVSVLDKELTTVSYHGLVNFLLLLLSATLLRLAIENYMKYGILVRMPGTSVAARDWAYSLAGLLAVFAGFVGAFAIEKCAIPARRRTASPDSGQAVAAVGIAAAEEKRTVALHAANLAMVLGVPAWITYHSVYQPALGTLVMMFACVMFLKLYSLAATNFDLRRAYRLGDARLDSDPLRFSSLERGRLVVGSGASGPGSGIGTEAGNVDTLMRNTVPRATRASFSQNARALDAFHVRADDRIDAKANALPRPRPRLRRATTMSEILRRVGSSASHDGTMSDGAASDGAASDGAPSDGTLSDSPARPEWLRAGTAPGSLGSPRPASLRLSRHAIHYSVAYPANITMANFGYFWLAPTLCYQPSYPRMAGPVRKSFLAKRLAELAILCLAIYVVIHQYAVPTLVGSVRAIDTRNAFWLSERVLKLSVISATVWFLGFYAIFHSGLNALAEALRFADRAFYLDWWNSVDLGAYWREWNLPIHYFCKRHIMMPLVSAPLSLPVRAGVLLTFLVSAIMHELLFGIPTHCLKGYSFIGMLVQIPLIQFTQWLVRWRGPESGLGNAVFWISFCIVGQPLGVVQYYYAWIKQNA
ncbi:hypothetical protein GGF46_003776 [Coemansia sp. RSA 552]|nr:hypothetical protein GGF46_003776 [Coemansia sp. RSA 552]